MEIRTITRRMKTIRNNIFQGMLTREDFEAKLARLKAANLSQRPTICALLCEMFRALKIDCKEGQEDSYYEQLVETSEFPAFRDIESRIMETMFANFDQYPTPEEYMLRIVNRLSDPMDEWKEDTLRLRILKQFVKYGGCGVYYREAKNEQGELILDEDGKVTQEKVTVYGGESYLKTWTKKKTGHSVKNIDDILDNLDDSVFHVLSEATKSQKKAKYAILKLADDLAQGKFKSGGATKKDLYLFAMVYDMTYYCGNSESDSIIDYDSDIEKNLFEDYYSNNLMRFITEAYSGNLSAYELDPSGMGINYKNFAEMVYIYFIYKDYTPVEKISRATDMIERLEKASSVKKSVSTETQYFVNLFTEEILEKSEEEFELFILQNYDCKTSYTYKTNDDKEKKSKKSAFQMQITQNRAKRIYERLINSLDTELCHCNYGLYFVDVSAFKKSSMDAVSMVKAKLLSRTPENYTEADWKNKIHQDFEQFVRLLMGINRFMGIEFDENKKHSNKVTVDIQLSETDVFQTVRAICTAPQAIDVQLSEADVFLSKAERYYHPYNPTEVVGKWANPEDDSPSPRPLPILHKQKPEEITRMSLMFAYYYWYTAEAECYYYPYDPTEVVGKWTNPEDDSPSSRPLPALHKQKPEEITRTSLMIAYYYWYNAENSDRKKTFIEVFDDYTNPEIGLNALLSQAGYQPINDKNIFDIALIFSSYAYLMC